MTDRPPTPPATLTRARELAMRNGLRYVYTGNVHDRRGGSTWCPRCGALLIERDWYRARPLGTHARRVLRRLRRKDPGRVRGPAGQLGREAAAGAVAPRLSIRPRPSPGSATLSLNKGVAFRNCGRA